MNNPDKLCICGHKKKRHRKGRGYCVGLEPKNGMVPCCGCWRFRVKVPEETPASATREALGEK